MKKRGTKTYNYPCVSHPKENGSQTRIEQFIVPLGLFTSVSHSLSLSRSVACAMVAGSFEFALPKSEPKGHMWWTCTIYIYLIITADFLGWTLTQIVAFRRTPKRIAYDSFRYSLYRPVGSTNVLKNTSFVCFLAHRLFPLSIPYHSSKASFQFPFEYRPFPHTPRLLKWTAIPVLLLILAIIHLLLRRNMTWTCCCAFDGNILNVECYWLSISSRGVWCARHPNWEYSNQTQKWKVQIINCEFYSRY